MNYEMPVQVSGRILSQLQRPDSPNPVPMEFSGEMLFENGVSATFYNSFLTEHQQWANISGTKGLLHVFDFVLPYENQAKASSSKETTSFVVSKSGFDVQGCDFRMHNQTRNVEIDEASNSSPGAQETRLFRRFNEIVLSLSLIHI